MPFFVYIITNLLVNAIGIFILFCAWTWAEKKVHTKRRTHKIIIIIKTDYGWAISRIRSIQRENYYWRVPENIKLIQCTWNTHNIQRIEATPMNVKIYIRYAFDNRYVWCGMRTTNQAIQEPKLHNAQLLIVCCNFHFIFIPCNFYRFFSFRARYTFFIYAFFVPSTKILLWVKCWLAVCEWVWARKRHTHTRQNGQKEGNRHEAKRIDSSFIVFVKWSWIDDCFSHSIRSNLDQAWNGLRTGFFRDAYFFPFRMRRVLLLSQSLSYMCKCFSREATTKQRTSKKI